MARPRVLIVDDEQLIREILADFLGMEGFEVQTAEDGVVALEKLQAQHFDLVLTDLKMPRMSGTELLAAVREYFPRVLVVLMSGFATVDAALSAMKGGAYDYILKPFRASDVVRVVQRGVEQRRGDAEQLQPGDLAAWQRVGEALRACRSGDELADALVEATLGALHGDRSLLCVCASEVPEQGWRVREQRRWDEGHDGELGELDDEAVRGRLARDGAFVVQGADALTFYRRLPSAPLHSLVAAELNASAERLGFLVVVSHTASLRFEGGQRKLLTMIGEYAGALMAAAQHRALLERATEQRARSRWHLLAAQHHATAAHCERVAGLSERLARGLGWSEAQVGAVRRAAMLHDVAQADREAHAHAARPGAEPATNLHEHSDLAARELAGDALLQPLSGSVRAHHERWDGEGFPEGLHGESIPLAARVVALADAYDMMTSGVGRAEPLSPAAALDAIEAAAGAEFDPELAAKFVELLRQWSGAEPREPAAERAPSARTTPHEPK